MKKRELNKLTITEAREMLDKKEISAVDILEDCLSEIENNNPEINALLEVYEDVKDQAISFDNGNFVSGPLAGIPVALKDNILRKGFIASASSKILENYKAPYSSTVVDLLTDAGAIFLGRANMDEFAMGSSTEHSAFGPTKNPLNIKKVPGGSSGGSAAAVAGNFVLGALGSDTAGSVRLPASFCGLVGMYPTYGSVSRYGLMAMGSSLDQIGPITKTVKDAELMYKILSTYDPKDAMSISPQKRIEIKRPFGKKIGVPWKFINQEGMPKKAKDEFEKALKLLKENGYEIIDIDLPKIEMALPAYYVIIPAEVSSNLARFDGMRYGFRSNEKDLLSVYQNSRGLGFGQEVRRRILIGTFVLSAGYHDAYYDSAQKVRQYLHKMVEDVLEKVDFIATPTSAGGAFDLGSVADPVSMYLSDIFTVPANMIGAPAITVPFGLDDEGMPLGFHLMTKRGSDENLFIIGSDLEKLRV